MSAQAPSRRRVSRDGFSAAELGTRAPLALAAVLLLLALLAAPEQPRHQEAICQRHNGVAACRVW
ncbi:MAG: serine protease inhibitor [Synechococcaceae cyanobacterium ELA182]